MERVLSDTELNKLNRYFNALNYLTVGQLYLLDNPLLKRPLKKEDIKKKIVGHWGTCPSQNFIFTHCNRVIKNQDLNMMMVVGPGHGGNAFVSNVYLEGTYSEVYPNITQDEEGMKKLFKQFSFPGGISSHVAPETPGSINEGGELGYSLAHAFGAVFDNPSLICTCIVGDGEAETGTLATSWHSNKFLNPITDGAVLPILHLNGYKIANPTILARISDDELTKLLEGYGWKPYFVAGDNPQVMHELMASTMDKCIKEIKEIQNKARKDNNPTRPIWPMIVLRTPKGWTGPVEVDGKIIENTFRAHQVPIMMDKDEHLELLESWMRSYKPQELFDDNGVLLPDLKELLPTGDRRMGANPHTNGGKLLRDLRTPDFKDYALDIKKPGQLEASDMTELGKYIKGVLDANKDNKNFRVFGPDETMSNRLGSVFETNNRNWNASFIPNDEFLAMDGRIMDSMLSENMCQGWLEGYLLTGRHGFFASYEAFIRVVDSMASQHAKWLKISKALSWKAPIASLNYILSSNVWQQDHNGYTHQDPGFLDHIANKKADIVRIYLPPDANCLLSCFDHCIKSKNYINVLVTSKHLRPQWLTMDQAIKHCTKGIGIWDFVSNDYGDDPDVVIACAGETPTLEAVAAVSILRKYVPEIKIRFINVVDLMKLQPKSRHPHGLSDEEFDMLFTRNKPIIFAFHGYPTLIHEFMYERHNKNLLVCGYNEEGSITTPFDMRVQNEIDRYHLVINVVKKLPSLGTKVAYITQEMNDKLIEHKEYITTYGIDMPEVRNFKWQ